MTRRRAIHVVATSARLLTGAVVAAACVIGVTAAVAAPWPTVQNSPAQVSVTPTAGDTVLVCSGPFRALGREASDVAQMSSAGIPQLTADSMTEREESAELATPELVGASGVPVFTGVAESGTSPLIAASESILLAAEDLVGLASAPCREPSTESWLIGGAVSTGTNDVILLSNPGDVVATATLTVYGLEQTSSSILVPAGTQVAVPLAASAAGAQQPVVRVTAAGAPVRAVLQSSFVQTLDPAGIDLQDSAGAPQREIVFAGVQVAAASTGSATTLLRVLATDADTEATVTVRATGSGAVAQQFAVPLEVAVPVEVNLDDLDVGLYSVEVSAQSSVVGAIWQSTGVGAGTDFAWMTPAPQISDEVLVAVPDGPSPRLHVVNDGTTDATVTLAPTGAGSPEDIEIPAGESATVNVTDEETYALSSTAPIRAALTLSGPHALAGWPVWPAASATEPITVYP